MGRKRLKWAAGTVLLMVALIAPGCGGGDESSTDSTTAPVTVAINSDLTKPLLIAQADKICEQTDLVQNKELKAYLKKHPKAESSPAGQRGLVSVAGLPPVEKELEELTALGAPEGDEAEVTAIFRSIQRAIKKGEENPEGLITGTNNPFEEAEKLAKSYGFQVCDQAL